MLYAITNNAGEWYYYTRYLNKEIKWSPRFAFTYINLKDAQKHQEDITKQGIPCRVVPFKQADI